MLNIVCTKYNNLYDYSFVNRLYGSLKEHTNIDFKFWCQTEDASGIDSNIRIIPLKHVDPQKERYHKISLLRSELLIGKCVSFDLDIIINRNIDHYLTVESERLLLLYSSFKDPKMIGRSNAGKTQFKDCVINSSIFSWTAHSDNTKRILEKHSETPYELYRHSFDRFLFWECVKEIATFKFDDFCSYKYQGFQKEKTFCIFNGVKDKNFMRQFW